MKKFARLSPDRPCRIDKQLISNERAGSEVSQCPINDFERAYIPEHCGCLRVVAVCDGDRVALRVVDGDGVGGLTAVEMVKYAVKG